jgi:catalase
VADGDQRHPGLPGARSEGLPGAAARDRTRPGNRQAQPGESGREFFAAHPEAARALDAIKARPFSSGFANASYHSLDVFRFINATRVSHAVRWAMMAVDPFEPERASAASAAPDKNYLFGALIARVRSEPAQWKLVITVAKPGDPTDDATIAWPADREKIEAGTLTLTDIAAEALGNCRDVTFDPLILPAGIEASDDPLLSARSATYAQSFRRREGEVKTPSAVAVPPTGGGR